MNAAVELKVKTEFQNKFKLLYGYDSEMSDDEDTPDGQKYAAKRKDIKFKKMMEEFANLQEDLEDQRTALTGVVEKVNRLIRHHGHDTNESSKGGNNLKSSLKGASKAAANIKTGKMSKHVVANKRFEEDRDRGKDSVNISEEEKRSFRGAKARDEMSSGVDPPQSQQASRAGAPGTSALPPAADPKNRTASNWNEEIINTSKEIHGEESQKSRAEMQSHRSSGPALDQVDN